MARYEDTQTFGKQEVGEPNPDWEKNYRQWCAVFEGKDFQKKLEELGAVVNEFFRFHGQEKRYERFRSSWEDAQGNKFPPIVDEGIDHPRIKGHKIYPDFVENGVATCVQVAFKDKQGRNCCANLNFQQPNKDFIKDMAYFFKVKPPEGSF